MSPDTGPFCSPSLPGALSSPWLLIPPSGGCRALSTGVQGWAAAIWTILLLAVLIVPVILLASSTIDGARSLAEHTNDGTFIVPPPPPSVESWPLIGPTLNQIWNVASNDSTQALKMLAPQLKTILPGVLTATAGIGLTVLQFFFSILISGALLAKAQSAAGVARAFCNRLFGERGAEFQDLVGSTIRSVTSGILGVALIQTVLAAAGFLLVGLPGAGLWAVIFLVAAVLQIGVLVLVPAAILVFATAGTSTAVIFLVWCIFVGLLDNVLKPILLGRGTSVPTAVVFLGAIGGFVAMGIIGLFVGAIVLSVGYELFLAWVEPGSAELPRRISQVRRRIEKATHPVTFDLPPAIRTQTFRKLDDCKESG